jgi:phosphoribosylpyrophosphate synthetase
MSRSVATRSTMILYALPVHRRLADALQELTGIEQGGSASRRFSNGELHVELDAAPAGRDCIVLGAVAPPDEHLLSTLLLCHTLKKEGARRITALLPYLGYARHDRAEPRKSRAAGIHRPLAHLTKTRTPEGVRHSILHGAIGPHVVLVDDILDTGGTLVSASEALQRAGVREIVVMATHGLFTGTAWERLWSLGVTRMYCTDTTPLREQLVSKPISVLPVAPLLAAYLEPPAEEARRGPEVRGL